MHLAANDCSNFSTQLPEVLDNFLAAVIDDIYEFCVRVCIKVEQIGVEKRRVQNLNKQVRENMKRKLEVLTENIKDYIKDKQKDTSREVVPKVKVENRYRSGVSCAVSDQRVQFYVLVSASVTVDV